MPRWPRYFDVRDFGAVGDGRMDCTKAFRDAVKTAGENSTIYIPSGTYWLNDTITIEDWRVHIRGDGPWATEIIFVPKANSPSPSCFRFRHKDPGALIYQCSISGLGFKSSYNPQTKVAIEVFNGGDVVIKDIATDDDTWRTVKEDEIALSNDSIATGPFSRSSDAWPKGWKSIGIWVRGHELIYIDHVTAGADRPIVISDNPEKKGYGCDHIVITSSRLKCKYEEGACLEIEPEVKLTNMVIDGTNAWGGGTYGLYWKGTLGVVSQNIRITNVRWERPDRDDGYGIYLHGVTTKNDEEYWALQNVILENVMVTAKGKKEDKSPAFSNGFYLEGIQTTASIRDCVYAGDDTYKKVPLHADKIKSLLLENVYFATPKKADINIRNMKPVDPDYKSYETKSMGSPTIIAYKWDEEN